MAGRRPKPTALKKLAGNPGKRALNANEPVAPSGIPDCPDHLDAEAQTEWKRVTDLLSDMRILTLADRACVAMYCEAWSQWIGALREVREQGAIVRSPNGYPIQNPFLSIANNAFKQMKSMLTELGLTPASRSRVNVPEAETKDPFADFLNEG